MCWKQTLALGLAVVLGACGSSHDNSNDGTMNLGAVGSTAGTVAQAGSGGVTGAAGAMPATGTAGAAGAMGQLPQLCPMDPGITTCGAESCPAVSSGQSTLCVQNCCTADNRCGTHNAAINSECMPPFMNTSMCPDESVMGSSVSGCCVEGTNECGIVDTLTGMGCLPRDDFRVRIFAMLAPLNCDGTPVMTGTAGAAGTGAAAGTGGAGAGGAGGAGAGGADGAGAGGAGGAGAGGAGGAGSGA